MQISYLHIAVNWTLRCVDWLCMDSLSIAQNGPETRITCVPYLKNPKEPFNKSTSGAKLYLLMSIWNSCPPHLCECTPKLGIEEAVTLTTHRQ